MPRYRRSGLADVLGQVINGELMVDQHPQHPNSAGIGQRAEYLDHQAHPIVVKPSAWLSIYVYTQIIAHGVGSPPPGDLLDANETSWAFAGAYGVGYSGNTKVIEFVPLAGDDGWLSYCGRTADDARSDAIFPERERALAARGGARRGEGAPHPRGAGGAASLGIG